MKQGDFTQLAKSYIYRTGYSEIILRMLASYVGGFQNDFTVADVGAGTGKLTEHLLELGFRGFAVEPNDAMREEGVRLFGDRQEQIQWLKGTAEATSLPDNCANWVFMASSFHWTKPEHSLKEFYRILKPGGYFTAIWNPRNLESSELHRRIEDRIHTIVPNLKRVSSGSSKYTQDIEKTLISTGHFKDVVFMETAYDVVMEKDRYLGAWRSVNDIQAQAGPEGFNKVMEAIEEEIADFQEIRVPYKTRAWTAQAL